MRQTFALLAIGALLLVGWAIVVQATRAMARSRTRRRRRLMRLYSVVATTPAPAPDYRLFFSQVPAQPALTPRARVDRLYAIGEFAAAAAILARQARS